MNQFPTYHVSLVLPACVNTTQPLCGLRSDWMHHLSPSNRTPPVGQQVLVIIPILKPYVPISVRQARESNVCVM